MEVLQTSEPRRLRVLDLFAGSRSLARAVADLPVDVYSVDLKPFPGIDLQVDAEYFDPADLPWTPDLLWASPPCTSYSIAGIRYHRDNYVARSPCAIKSDRLVTRVISLALQLDCDFVIENPRGVLRKMPFIQDLPRRTVTYCSYGDRRMKPTDLWSNMFSGHDRRHAWHPRPACINANPACDHERQSRYYWKRKQLGQTKLGTQGMSNAFERSTVPAPLLVEVVAACAIRCGVDLSSRALARVSCACPTVPFSIVQPNP